MTRILATLALILMSPNLPAQTEGCDTLLRTTALARTALERRPDQSFELEIDYSTETRGTRVVALPGVIATLADVPNLRIVVLAGNSGTEYETTRHNLAFAFGDHVIRTFEAKTHSSRTDFVVRETVRVSYDDGTARSWTSDFTTEPGVFRTASGEVFYVPSLDGAPVLIVKAIGDYNEVGDFAVPIIDALNVPATRVLLVHDDLLLPEATVRLDAGAPQKFAGNNAVLSLIRTLSYQIFDDVAVALDELAPGAGLPADRERQREAFRMIADVRYQNHLGDPKAYHQAFKNIESIRAPLGPLLNAAREAANADRTAAAGELRRRKSERGRELGPISKQLADRDTSPADRARLEAARDELRNAAAPLGAQIKMLEEESAAVDARITAVATDAIERRLRFARLSIGSDDGTLAQGASKIDYVLGPYPREVFTPEVWDQAARLVATWATTPPTSPEGTVSK